MVAKINTGKSIIAMINYNERKVSHGQAECILASKYGCEPEELNFHQKLKRLNHLTVRNSLTKTNAVHISLNFDPGEKLSKNQLESIASRYMDMIGFDAQPYLVYQHFDAAHPHIHIATTNIQPDGKRIDLQNIGRNQSEVARKQLEHEFNLVRAGSKSQNSDLAITPVKVIYGVTDTMRGITSVVNSVMRQYNFTTMAEFNAVLKQYNVFADRGREHTRMYQNRGLIYQVLDLNSRRVGVPIKASAIYGKPTLKALEEKFAQNSENRKYPKAVLKNTLDKVFYNHSKPTRELFIDLLKKEKIDVIFHEDNQGLRCTVIFIDHKTKSVFKGSDIVAHYSAGKIIERLRPEIKLQIKESILAGTKNHDDLQEAITRKRGNENGAKAIDFPEIRLMEKPFGEQAAGELKRKRKKTQKK